MTRNRLQNEAVKSLTFLSSPSIRLRPSALFPRPRHVRLQQQRTFRWSGTSGLRQTAQEQVGEAAEHVYTKPKAQAYAQEADWEDDELRAPTQQEYLEREGSRRVKRPLEVPYENVQRAQQAMSEIMLQQASPHEVLSVFTRAAKCPGYLETLAPTRLKAIMELVGPEKILLPYREIHQSFHTAVLRLFGRRTLDEIFSSYTADVEVFMSAEGQTLEQLATWKLKYLLRIAAVTGDGQLAERLFGVLDQSPNHTLDLDTCNKFLQAICWSGAHQASGRFRLQVNKTEFHAGQTSSSTTRLQDQESETFQIIDWNRVKDQVFSVVERMRDLEIEPDVETWTNVMLALAREGDVRGVKSTMRRVWDVDTDAVARQDESSLLFENHLAPDSPNFPKSETLFAVAHAFCINNDVATALQMVDFLSRKYNLPVQVDTWVELLEWTYVHSVRRNGRNKDLTAPPEAARLPEVAVRNLWETIRSPPFNVKINAGILYCLFKNTIKRGALGQALELMGKAHELYVESEMAFKQSNAKSKGTRESNLELELQDFRRMRDFDKGCSYFQDLLSSFTGRRLRLKWDKRSHIQAWWYHRMLPDLIGRYQKYSTPYGNAYSIPDGRIHFTLKNNNFVALKENESPFPGVRLFQMPVVTEKILSDESTRQSRLQLRHRLKGSPRNGPKWNPAWFDRQNVRDWYIDEWDSDVDAEADVQH